MDNHYSAEDLARIWIDYWNEGAPELIPLAESFTHSSPYGHVEGRIKFLEWVKPLAAHNVVQLKVLRILSSSKEAAVHFEMLTPKGVIQACDWIVVADGLITEIHSFYDATALRE